MRETVFLIGGGPSAGPVDTSDLPGFRIGVNDAAFHKPCDAFFSNDHNYAIGIRTSIEAFPGERHLCAFQRHHERFCEWRGITMWRRVYSLAPTLTGHTLASGGHSTPGCSGYVALNLAARMGARRIVLIGYDFHDAYNYFFTPDPYPRHSIPGVRASFREVAKHYRRLGVEIINTNPDSAIDAFPRMSLEAALCLVKQPFSQTLAPVTTITAGARPLRRAYAGMTGGSRRATPR